MKKVKLQTPFLVVLVTFCLIILSCSTKSKQSKVAEGEEIISEEIEIDETIITSE